MTCRAPTNASTCTGTPAGAQLTYDNQGQLIGWQNAPSSPTTDAFAYDGSGQRVEQFAATSGSTTTTTYLGNLEEVSTPSSGIPSTATCYYDGTTRIAEAVNGAFSSLGNDVLGTPVVALDARGESWSPQRR